MAAARHRGTHTVEGIASPSHSDPRARRHPRRASKGRPRTGARYRERLRPEGRPVRYRSRAPPIDVIIREASRADVPAITDLFNALIPTTTVTWREELSTTDEQLAWFEERQSHRCPTLIADDDGDVVGYCCWTSFRGGDRFPGYRHTVEHSIHVRGDRHGRGIGRMLLDELARRAGEAGVHVMVAGIDADNVESIAFHQAVGFREVARLPETGYKFGRWLDLVLMQRIVDR
jgi:L-amino acid N-acyltransferase